jgi:hypothetical protein
VEGNGRCIIWGIIQEIGLKISGKPRETSEMVSEKRSEPETYRIPNSSVTYAPVTLAFMIS